MSQLVFAAVAVLLVYLALRVARMRRSLPFIVAYPLFVAILVGGSVAAFVAASNGAVVMGFNGGDPRVRAGVFAATAVAALVLWFVARLVIGRGK